MALPFNIISSLFALDLDLPLQLLFLSLDPLSLKQCRLVCKLWDDFIRRRVWGTSLGSLPHTRLRQKLAFHWRHASPPIRSVELDVASLVNCVACDDEVVVCGMQDATAKVYTIQGLSLAADLDCRTPLKPCSDVRPDVGEHVVATVTDQGDVSVWKKCDWSNVYKRSHHGDLPVYAVKVLPGLVLTGGCDGRVAVLSWVGEQFSLDRRLGEDPPDPMPTFQTPMDNPWHVTSLDSKEDWVLVGTSRQVKLWSLTDGALVKTFDTSWIYSLALSYPYGVISRGTGLAVLDLRLSTGQEMRNIPCHDKGGRVFCNIRHNENVLVGSIPNSPEVWYESRRRQSVCLFNLKPIIRKERREDFWIRRKCLAPGKMALSSCVNTSCLVAAQGKHLHVWDFWNCDEFSDAPDQDFEISDDDSSDEDDDYRDMLYRRRRR